MKFQISGTYTDLYQLAMGQAYFINDLHNKPAGFDYFFRQLPFDGGYVLFAGLSDLLQIIRTLEFSHDDLVFLEKKGFRKDYLDLLKKFKFTGNIYSIKEGDVVFPYEPIVRVEGSMLETQLIETLLLNILNFQSLIATKAARIQSVAEGKTLSEFGLRRAQGPGGVLASRAAVVGGFDSTSNVFAAKQFKIPFSGTMAHSFIQMYGDELKAFRTFAEAYPENCILLVDTYDTLKSGVPNAIKVAKEMEKKGHRLHGIRLDSGDLSYFARKSRQMLDDAGLEYVKIAASNQLDEYVIRSLIQQKAPIDIFGVGTNLATGKPDAALDGVYKSIMAENEPRIKVSDSIQKTTIPGPKQVYRMLDENGDFYGADAIVQKQESELSKMIDPFDEHKYMNLSGIASEKLLQPVMKRGKLQDITTDIMEVKAYAAKRLEKLPPEYKRFENPHKYKVGVSPETKKL